MAFKTIGIDLGDDTPSRRQGNAGRSFSAVDLLAATEQLRLSEGTLDAMARVIAARKDDLATAARFSQ